MLNYVDFNSVTVVALANVLLTEVAKRWKAFPLDPKNADAVRITSMVVALAGSVGIAYLNGTLALVDVKTALSVVLENAILAWSASHVAYNALPYIKGASKDGDESGNVIARVPAEEVVNKDETK